MKKILLLLSVVIAAGFLITGLAESQGGEKNLYQEFSDMEVAKVYVAPVTDSTSSKSADILALKTQIEVALTTRQTINFEIVPKEEADYVIKANVTEYVWYENDPIDAIIGLTAILMDAMVQENYARLSAVFTVKDLKENEVIWEDKVKATITEREMTMVDSLGMLNERLVRTFMREAFSKGHSS